MSQRSFGAETEQLLHQHGFDSDRFAVLRHKLMAGDFAAVGSGKVDPNKVRGAVEHVTADDMRPLPPLGSPEREALHAEGLAAIAKGEVALVILAGGMATRFGGVVKANVPAVDHHTFLDLKLADARLGAARAEGVVPVYLMTSFATDSAVREAAAAQSTEACPVEVFTQHLSVRLTPDGETFLDSEGQPSLHATGHGDLPYALASSGVLDAMARAGVRQVIMSNVDNLTGTLDPAIVAMHRASGRPMSAEVAPKLAGDRGGAPARVDGHAQVVEAFRFPDSFDQDSIRWFSTNTLVFDLQALQDPPELTWFCVRKTVDGREAIQFERLVGELSAFMPCGFIQIARDGEDARFQPVKNPAELESRQQEIRLALKARGVLD